MEQKIIGGVNVQIKSTLQFSSYKQEEQHFVLRMFAEAAWDDLQYEPQRQLLGQCPGGADLQQPEARMDR